MPTNTLCHAILQLIELFFVKILWHFSIKKWQSATDTCFVISLLLLLKPDDFWVFAQLFKTEGKGVNCI